MSDLLQLKSDHVKPLLRKLARQYRLVAPLRTPQGDTLFAEVDDLENATIDLNNRPQNSLKSFLFPQQEVLSHYQVGAMGETGTTGDDAGTAGHGGHGAGEHTTPQDAPPTGRPQTGSYRFTPVCEEPPPTLYFGVRPCDINAVLYLDVVLLPGRRDPAYFRRRQNSLLIGLNCNQPFADCFCHAMKAGPFLEAGFDLQLTDLGDRFLVETGRAGGEEITRQWGIFFSPASKEEINRRFQLFLEARDGFTRQVHADQAIKRLAAGEVPEAVWQEMAHRCHDCGGCAYLCPTCTCFSIIDRPLNPTSGQRLRVWDACTFTGFSAMAGGHNPVEPSRLLKQRFMHKLAHDVKKHGRPSCVGCGRCLNACFGGADMLRFLDLAGAESR